MGAELDEERDYDVDVKLKITFKNREFNCLLQPEIEEGIVEFLKAINGDYMIPESESVVMRPLETHGCLIMFQTSLAVFLLKSRHKKLRSISR